MSRESERPFAQGAINVAVCNARFLSSFPPSRSPYRRGVLDAAGVPELVQAARDGEGRMDAEVAVERFAVVADRRITFAAHESPRPRSAPTAPTSRITSGFCERNA